MPEKENAQVAQAPPSSPEAKPAPGSPSPAGKKKKSPLLIIAIVVVLILAGVIVSLLFQGKKGSAITVDPNAPLRKVTVRLAWLHQAQFAGFYLAKEKGYYKDAGLDVTLKEYEDGLSQGEEMSAKKVDFTIQSPIELFNSVGNGAKLQAVAVIYQSSPYAFASLKSKNITQPSQFKGKVLGIKGGSLQGKATYPAMLNQFGLSAKDATIKDMDFSVDEADDLMQGRADVIDLYRTDQTYSMDKKGLSYNLILPDQYNFDTYGDMIITHKDIVASDPEMVQAFVTASLKGWNDAVTNPEEGVAASAKYAQTPEYKDIERERYILEKSIPLIQPTKGVVIGLLQFIPFSRTYEAMTEAGLIKTPFEVQETYTTQFLPQ